MNNKLKAISRRGLCVLCLVKGFIILAVIISAQTRASGQSAAGQTAIEIKSARPLAHALDRVQELLRSPINYEEVPYENAGDFSERSTAAGLKPLRGGHIMANIEPAGGDPYLAVQILLDAYTSAQLPGRYNAVQNDGSIDVIPTQVLAADGSMRNITPVMSRPVAFPSTERLVVDTLNLIVDSLSKVAGVRVVLLSTPFHYSMSPQTDKVTLGATGEPARNVIANLVAKFEPIGYRFGPMSYRLLYDPWSKAYYLSLISIPASHPKATELASRTNTPAAARENPFFTKKK